MTYLKDLDLERSNSKPIPKETKPQPYTLSRETPPLEIRNNKLQKLNAKLHANYKAAQATISELQTELGASAERNSKLEGAIADACNAIDGFVGSCAPVKTYDVIRAESWDRNKIVDARISLRNTDADGEVNSNDEADKIVLEEKRALRELELRCDCGITFNATGDNLASIKTRHRISKSQKRRRRRAKRKGMTSVEARGDASASACQLASVRLRCGTQRHDVPDGSKVLSTFIILVLISVLLYYMDTPKQIFGW